MLGGTRNGRAVKLALLVGAVLLVLYFLISWRVEAQTLSKDLETAEEEYVKVLKKLHRVENELTGV
jgi:TRAP-type C4-dicarboxylate transport system permease small subunit